MGGAAARVSRPARRSQAERTALSDRQIMEAAVRLVAEQGYSRTTLAQIGRAAGYSAGLVSHRFGSKAGLLRAMAERITQRFTGDQLQPALARRTGLDALGVMASTYLRELLSFEERMRALYVIMAESLGPVPELRDFFVDLNRQFRTAAERMLREGIAAGQIRSDVDPVAEAVVFIGMLRGIVLQWLVERGSVDLTAVIDSVQDGLRERLTTRPALPPPGGHA